MALASIGEIIKTKLSVNSWQAHLLKDWPNIVGPLHEQMRIEKIERDCLVLGVYDPHWMHELFMLAPTIIETIRQTTGHTHIAHLRFVYVAKKENPQKTEQTATKAKKEPKELSPRQEQVLTRVHNVDLQKALRSFFNNCVS